MTLHEYLTEIDNLTETDMIWLSILVEKERSFARRNNLQIVIKEDLKNSIIKKFRNDFCDVSSDIGIDAIYKSSLDKIIELKKSTSTPEEFETLLQLLK